MEMYDYIIVPLSVELVLVISYSIGKSVTIVLLVAQLVIDMI